MTSRISLFVFLLSVMNGPALIFCQNPYAQNYDIARIFLTTATSDEFASCQAPGVGSTINPTYSTSFTYTSTNACLQPYEKICRAPSGAVRCNEHDAKVKETKRSSIALYPALNTKGSGVIEQCVSEGEYQHADANAVLIAQTIVSFFVIIACAALVLVRTWQHLSPFVRYWFLFMMVVCIILLPSYYYLNGLIGVGAALIAATMFSTQNPTAIAIGISSCFTAVMWFTFDSGLGYLTHSSRLRLSNSGNTAHPLYENFCNAYYRYTYYTPFPNLKDNTNPLMVADNACLRGWLSTELFFSVFLILSLIVLGVAGSHALTNAKGHSHKDAEASSSSTSSE